MLRSPIRAMAALLLPLMLAACVLAPGKFTATLTINADRSFAYTYQGEIYAMDPGKQMAGGMRGASEGDKPDPAKAARDKAEFDRKASEIAAALRREAGYRKVDYLGDGRFVVDYAISGRLTHHFVYPFNLDAEAIIPFVAVELRADGKVRVKAPAFARESGMSAAPPGMGDAGGNTKLDGVFTLDTDAEVISQNNEGGVANSGGRKRVVWTVSPLTKEAPMAVLGSR